MAGEIIRLGDRTSHDGTVIEGSQIDICMGMPIAYLGHKVHCPKCKGDYPIVEGVMTTPFYGKGVAVAGMKTSCGAVLLAGQFTDIIEWGGGGAAASQANAGEESRQSIASIASNPIHAALMPADQGAPVQQNRERSGYDLDFTLTDEVTGAAMADWPYVIELSSGRRLEGRTDQAGKTERVCAEFADNAVLRVLAPECAPINPHWDH